MKKILLILAFSNTLTSELILEITQGTEDPYRVAILKFEGDEKVSNDIDKIIRNNLKRSGEFNLFANEDLLSLPTSETEVIFNDCLLYTSPSPRDRNVSRMPSSA